MFKAASWAWHKYAQCLVEHPVKTKGLTCGVLSVAGDAFYQHRMSLKNEQEYRHSFLRSGKIFVYGTVLLGPLLHFWFRALDRIVPLVTHHHGSGTVKEVVAQTMPLVGAHTHPHLFTRVKFPLKNMHLSVRRVVVEQMSYSILVICMFFVVVGVLDYLVPDEKTSHLFKDRHFIEVLKEKFRTEFRDAYENGLKLWPIANFVNFLGRYLKEDQI